MVTVKQLHESLNRLYEDYNIKEGWEDDEEYEGFIIKPYGKRYLGQIDLEDNTGCILDIIADWDEIFCRTFSSLENAKHSLDSIADMLLSGYTKEDIENAIYNGDVEISESLSEAWESELEADIDRILDDESLSKEEKRKLLDKIYASYGLDENYSLAEAVNHENDEINALLRKYVGKKNIPAKDRKAIEAAGIQIKDAGDRISFEGSNGKKLWGYGRTDRYGPKTPMTHPKNKWRKERDQFRTNDWDLSQGRGYRGDTYYKEPEGDSWDKVDLKGYLDSNRNNTWDDYEDYNRPGSYNSNLRPYSDDYKRAVDERNAGQRMKDVYYKDRDMKTDDEIEAEVEKFRQKLLNARKSAENGVERYTNKINQANADIDAIKARAKAKHGINEDLDKQSIYDKVEDALFEIASRELYDNIVMTISSMVPEYNPDWFGDSDGSDTTYERLDNAELAAQERYIKAIANRLMAAYKGE